MSAGRLIAVVGPSGVGKDSVMAGIRAADPRFTLARRAITRAPDPGGEDHEAMSPEDFAERAKAGGFCLHWSAHGLHYGLPSVVLDEVRAGAECLANLSRLALPRALEVFPRLTALSLSASPQVLAERLAARGREAAGEIAGRMSRAAPPLPAGLEVIAVANDGALADTLAEALRGLRASD